MTLLCGQCLKAIRKRPAKQWSPHTEGLVESTGFKNGIAATKKTPGFPYQQMKLGNTDLTAKG